MDLLKKSVENYSKYVDFNYTFTLDCQISISVAFRAENFYHLSGLQYLKDIVQLDRTRPGNSVKDIYKKVLKGKITQNLIEKSDFYNMIEKRLQCFSNLDDVISAKIIIDFDYSKVPKTEILSKYLLYKEYDDGYAILGLKHDSKNDIYIPETFFFNETDYYFKNQILYNVIDVTREHYKS